MKTFLARRIPALIITMLASLFAAHAHASCAVDSSGSDTALGWLQQQAIAASPAQERALGLSPAVSYDNSVRPGHFKDVSIVGLWKFTFVSKGTPGVPDGAVLDAGFATWHRDGTELSNSSRPPKSGNFCMGVYKEIRRATYKLNHVGLSWDPTGMAFQGPASIHQLVTLDRSGNSYAGTFTIDQYAQDGTTLIVHLAGIVTATRITVD